MADSNDIINPQDMHDVATSAITKTLARFADRILDDVLESLDRVQTPLSREAAEAAVHDVRKEIHAELSRKK